MSRTVRVTSKAFWLLVVVISLGLCCFYSTNLPCLAWQNVRHLFPKIPPDFIQRYAAQTSQFPPLNAARARHSVSAIQATNATKGMIESHTRDTRRNTSCLRNAFADILLVIVYNYPYFESIKLLQSFYRAAFPNMVVCGPYDGSFTNVMSVNIAKGVLGYECLGQAIRQRPGYAGYLYINDDVVLNYWNLKDFDKTKIWQSPNVFSSTRMYGELENNWYWWVSPYGLPNCRESYEQLLNMTLGHYPANHLVENGNGTLRCFSGRSDILYIPKRHAPAFSLLSFIFHSRKVFLEIAVPTILRILEKEENIRHLPGYYIPGDVRKEDVRVTDSRFFWFIYFSKKDVWFIHPFKLHHGKLDRNFNVLMLKHFLIEKTKSVTAC